METAVSNKLGHSKYLSAGSALQNKSMQTLVQEDSAFFLEIPPKRENMVDNNHNRYV